MYVYKRARARARVCVCVCVCVCVRTCIYLYICIVMYVYCVAVWEIAAGYLFDKLFNNAKLRWVFICCTFNIHYWTHILPLAYNLNILFLFDVYKYKIFLNKYQVVYNLSSLIKLNLWVRLQSDYSTAKIRLFACASRSRRLTAC